MKALYTGFNKKKAKLIRQIKVIDFTVVYFQGINFYKISLEIKLLKY